MKMYDIKIASSMLGSFTIAGVIVSAGLAIGLVTHYLIDYPRRRKRFKEIEETHGPIHHLLKICSDCGRPCRIEKSYAGVLPFYFSILNDEIPPGTRSMAYYFSSVYLMFTHIAFLSAVMGTANSIALCWYGVRMTWALIGISIAYSVVLLTLGVFLTKKGAPPEAYLVRMFEMQKEWLKRNENRVREKLCESHKHKVES